MWSSGSARCSSGITGVLWLKLSPLAHATVTLAGRATARTETAVIGPAQFGDLAAAPADRSITLNQRLAGPVVWRGGDLAVAGACSRCRKIRQRRRCSIR